MREKNIAHQHLPPQPCPDLIAQDEIIPITIRNINKLWETRENMVRDVSVQAAMCKNVVQPLADAEHAIEDTVGMIEMLKYAAPNEYQRSFSENYGLPKLSSKGVLEPDMHVPAPCLCRRNSTARENDNNDR